MSERKHEQKVKDVRVDDDCLYIELLNGLRLTGPMRPKAAFRDPVVPVDVRPMPTADAIRPAAAT